MRDNDGRKLDHKLLEELRLKAVREVVEGAHPEEVALALGLHRKTVYGWVARYRADGPEALRAKPPPGRPPKLTDQQLRRLFAVIVDGDPRDLRFDAALWTRQVVRVVVRRELEVALSVASVGRLLDRMGLSPERPLARATRSTPDALARWKHEEFPNIRIAAEVSGATLYFCDESVVGFDAEAGGAGEAATHMISVVTTKGALRFAAYGGEAGAETFVDFCRRLLHDARRPAYVVVDGGPAQRSEEAQRFVESTCGQLRLFFLPLPAGLSSSGRADTPPEPIDTPAPAGSRRIPGQRRSAAPVDRAGRAPRLRAPGCA